MHSGPPELHYETIDRLARPARVAVLTDSSDADWRHTTVRIIEFLSSVWGGKHSLIVPTDGLSIEPVFWTVLEKFSPDYLFTYQKTGNDIRISRPDEYAVLLQNQISGYYTDGDTSDEEKERIDKELRKLPADQFNLDTRLRSQIADRLVPFHYEKHFERISGHGYVPRELTSIANLLPYVDHAQGFSGFQVPAELDAVWWAAYTGIYPAELSEQLRTLGLNEKTTCVAIEDLAEFVRWAAGGEVSLWGRALGEALGHGLGFVPPDEKAPTPFDISMLCTGLYGSPLSHQAVADRFAIVIGDSIADFCLSYCLPRIGHPAAWLPTRWINELERSESTPLKSSISSALYAASHEVRRGPGFKVCSASLEADRVAEVLEVLKRHLGFGLNGEVVHRVDARFAVAAATDALTLYCTDSPNQPEIYPFLGHKSVGAIRSPRPTGFSKLTTSKHRWVAEIIVSGRAVPTVPHIADNLVILRPSVGGDEIRVSRKAVAYACPGSGLIIGDDMNANLRNAEIRLFDTFIAVSGMATANGLKCQLSDKGIYQRDSIEKFGGISETASFLRNRASRAVLRKFLDHSERKKGIFDEGCVLHADRRTYLDLAAALKVMGEDEIAAVTLLDKLVATKVIYRGFVLGCSVCKHAEWYSLADLADEFRCTRCGREQTIRREHWKQPAAPQIFYKLDEIVYQFLKSDGDVVALGLDYMSRSSSHPFNYSPEIEFRKDPTLIGEIDFCAVWDGVVALGEAKKQGELASSDYEARKIIDKYTRLATMLNAKRVVFCTTSPEWKSSTLQAVHLAFEGKLAVPVFLAAEDLLGKPSMQA